MHSIFKLIKNRHSVRAFKPKKLTQKQINTIKTTLEQAPSAGNLKAYKFTVFEDSYYKQMLRSAALDERFISDAPAVIVFMADINKSKAKNKYRGDLYAIQDATIACCYAQLAAEALGLSSCWVGAFQEELVSMIVGYVDGLKPVALLAVGYNAKDK